MIRDRAVKRDIVATACAKRKWLTQTDRRLDIRQDWRISDAWLKLSRTPTQLLNAGVERERLDSKIHVEFPLKVNFEE